MTRHDELVSIQTDTSGSCERGFTVYSGDDVNSKHSLVSCTANKPERAVHNSGGTSQNFHVSGFVTGKG